MFFNFALSTYKWVLDVCYTIIGQPFSDFVREKIVDRNEKLADKNDLNVAIDPKILDIIKSSSQVSTQHGSSVHLLKVGAKRRRTRAEIEEFRSL